MGDSVKLLILIEYVPWKLIKKGHQMDFIVLNLSRYMYWLLYRSDKFTIAVKLVLSSLYSDIVVIFRHLKYQHIWIRKRRSILTSHIQELILWSFELCIKNSELYIKCTMGIFFPADPKMRRHLVTFKIIWIINYNINKND